MSENRKITTSEIVAVGSILQDKDAIELLKKINEQVVTEEDTKGKRKQNDIFAFVGFAHQDDILGEDPESEDYKTNEGLVKKLVDKGLILEGFHVPLERKNEKKFGDLHIPATQDKIGKYKITEEGLAVLALVGNNNNNNGGQQQQEQQPKQKQTVTKVEPSSPSKKEKAIAAFKEEVKEENKL